MLSSETLKILKKYVPKSYINIYTSWHSSRNLNTTCTCAEIASHSIYHAERFYRWLFYKYEGKITRKNAAEFIILRNFEAYLRMHKKHISHSKEIAAKKEILVKLLKVKKINTKFR